MGTAVDRRTLQRDDVWPCYRCCPMGFSWSLFFAQRVSEYICESTGALEGSRLFNDRSDAVVFEAQKGGHQTKRHYVYVDNLGALGSSATWTAEAQAAMRDTFNGSHLDTHGEEIIEGDGEVLGVELDLNKFENRSKHSKVMLLRGAITA